MNICKICGKEIISNVLYKGDYDKMNLSTIWPGDVLDLDGHKVCLENINDLIIKPNRGKTLPLLEEWYKNGHNIEELND